MFEYDQITKDKITALRGIPGPQVGELVAIFWPAPTGTIYYSTTQLDLVMPGIPVSPVEARLIPENPDTPETFQSVLSDSSIGDGEVNLSFYDGDGTIADLAHGHGEGIKVEISYWFPQVDLLLKHWWGHLRPPEDASEGEHNCSAAIGFRSPLLPLPRRAFFDTCQAIYGALLTTAAEIADNDCRYDRHIGGTHGLLSGGLPILSCSRASRAVCAEHIGDELEYLGDETPVQTIVIGQSGGASSVFSSRGNTSNLKRPRRVIYGHRIARDLALIAFTPTINTNHPDQGFVRVLFGDIEGPIQSMTGCAVNNLLIAAEHLNTRLGTYRQSPTSFSSAPNNYQGTAVFYANYGQVNAAQYGPQNLNGQATIDGKNDIRVYSTPTTFTRQYSTNRAWCLRDMLRNKRYGHGSDDSRLENQDWIDLAAWSGRTFGFTDPGGTVWSGITPAFNADMQGDRTTQQQINDCCLAGRFSLPFPFQGKDRILALKSEDLTNVKLFTDRGADRNICVDEDEKSTLTRSQISDTELPNQLVVTFEDAAKLNVERPLTFSDVAQQLRAGRAFGDTSIRVVEKKYNALGITALNEAVWFGNLLLDLGEFDSGGLRNNLRISFVTWFLETLELHPYAVIRVLSNQLARYGFEYFRIMSMERRPDLKVAITAQAYPPDYYETVEVPTTPIDLSLEAEAPGNTRTGTAVIAADASCSGGAKVTGIGNGTGTLQFNNVAIFINQLWDLIIYYKCATALTGFVRINSGASLPVSFPATGPLPNWTFITTPIPISATNTITFSNPTGPAPDIDKIAMLQHEFDPNGGNCRPGIGPVTYEDGRIIIPTQPCT